MADLPMTSDLVLPARCDRAATEALLPDFVAAVGNNAIRVDGSAVEHVGQAMLQMLVAARRCGGSIIEPSVALLEAARLTGLEGELFEEGER